MERFNYLVIGAGIAGLTFAHNVAAYGSVAIICKRGMLDSNTAWAQGGIAAVGSKNDSAESHINDTEIAGAGLCQSEIVKIVVREGPERVRELIELGVKFDRLANAKDNPKTHGLGDDFDLTQEGGHSHRRIYHAADATGREIQRALIAACQASPNIQFFEDSNAIDLISTHKLSIELDKPNKILGAYVLMSNGEIQVFLASKTLVATGGAGKIYLYTSNPDIASGDGIAMCFRAGVDVANLEFFQFHPTCLYHPKAKSFLITEAMRGEGARLLRTNGQEFMHKYHEQRELAPRDIVARAIDHEMKEHGEDFVLLDISHRPKDFIIEHFPNIYKKCLEYNFDITKGPIPVVPAAHYCCGGVLVDQFGRTNIKDLYVAGEAASTGLHGANRLASNSLLEALVFAKRAALDALKEQSNIPNHGIVPLWDTGTAVDSDELVLISQTWDEIRRFMWNFVGIVRSTRRLERALRRSNMLQREINEYYWNFKLTSDLLELRNLSLVSNLVIHSALLRRESRGLHYTTDYPQANELYRQDTIIRAQEYRHFQRNAGLL